MKKLTVFILAALVLLTQANPVEPANLEVRPPGGIGTLGDVYPTIQAAIDDASPGDTITVHAGTYTENIDIDKRIILQGDGSGSDDASNTIITAALGNEPTVQIMASGNSETERLIITDIRITGATDGGNVGSGIEFVSGSGSYTTLDNVAAVGNGGNGIATDIADAMVHYDLRLIDCNMSNNGASGFNLNSTDAFDGLTITGCLAIGNQTSQGLYLEGQITGVNISGCTLTNNGDTWDDCGIYFMQLNNGFASPKDNQIVNCEISGNGRGIFAWSYGGPSLLIDDVNTSGNTQIQYDFMGAISIYNTGAALDDLQIINSKASGNAASGIYATAWEADINNLTINNVDVNDNGLYGIYMRGYSATINDGSVANCTIAGNQTGLRLRGNVNSISITDNEIADNIAPTTGILLDDGAAAGGSEAHNNIIVGNVVGANNVDVNGFDATYNWWGNATGPYHPVTNVGGLGDEVSDHVIYYPWYIDSNMTSPVYKPVHNITIDAYYDKIQDAVDGAYDGDTIEVAAGTYAENVIVNKELTLYGSKAGIDPRGGAWGSATSIINPGAGGYGMDIRASNVNINGFEVTGGMYGIYIGSVDANNVTVAYNDLHDNEKYGLQAIGIGSNVSFIDVSTNYIHHNGRNGLKLVDATDCTISSNEFAHNGSGAAATKPEYKYGIFVEDERYNASQYSPAIRNTFTYNDFHDNALGAINMEVLGNAVSSYWTSTKFLEDTVVKCNTFSGDSSVWGINVDNDYQDDGSQDGFGEIAVVDGTSNWWGNVSGPSGEGGGSGASVSEHVDFFPWLLSENCDDTTEVVADLVVDDDWASLPDYATVIVDGIDYYIGINAFDTIQGAVDAAADGNSIKVAEGAYVGAEINKNIKLIGANPGGSVITSGVPYKSGSSLETAFKVDDGADGAEIRNFTIDCNQADSFFFAIFARLADDVTVDSVTVNKPVQGITNYGGSNWKITNNVLNETEAAGGGGIAIYLGAYPPTYTTLQNNIVQGNVITPAATAPTFTCPAICMALDVRYGAYDNLTGDEDLSYNRIVENDISGTGEGSEVGVEIGIIGLEEDANKMAATLGIVHDNVVRGNIIDSTDWGVYCYTVADLAVQGNDIIECNEAVHVSDAHTGLAVNYNNFWNSDTYGVNNTSDTVVDAAYNWWDHPSGPEDQVGTSETDGATCYSVATIKNADGLGDPVSENAEYCPWLTAPVLTSDYLCPPADLDFDCDVDFYDLAVLASNWLAGVTP